MNHPIVHPGRTVLVKVADGRNGEIVVTEPINVMDVLQAVCNAHGVTIVGYMVVNRQPTLQPKQRSD